MSDGPSKRRPGRRPGSADTRGEILAAARNVFAEKGFDKATVRGIARVAEVDPALVHHYFSTKEGMFVEAMQLPINPEEVVPTILDGPRDEIGERLVRLILTLTGSPEARQPVIALIRSAMTNDNAVAMFRSSSPTRCSTRWPMGSGCRICASRRPSRRCSAYSSRATC